MAAPAHNAGGSSNHANAMSPDTLITIKITVNDVMKKMKLPLRDLSAAVLPGKVRRSQIKAPPARYLTQGWLPCVAQIFLCSRHHLDFGAA